MHRRSLQKIEKRRCFQAAFGRLSSVAYRVMSQLLRKNWELVKRFYPDSGVKQLIFFSVFCCCEDQALSTECLGKSPKNGCRRRLCLRRLCEQCGVMEAISNWQWLCLRKPVCLKSTLSCPKS